MWKKLDELVGKSVIVKFNTIERSGTLEKTIDNLDYFIELNRYERVQFTWLNVKKVFENIIILHDFEKGV